MRMESKICLAPYKIAYSICYLILLSLIRPVVYVDEIGVAMDPNVALLAVVFCAETYVMERSARRWEIFTLFSRREKTRVILRRFLIQAGYLWGLSLAGYFLFFWQKPYALSEVPFWKEYVEYAVAAAGTVLFWGAFSMSVSNLCRSQWSGIGIAIVAWMLLNSTFGQEVFGSCNVFSYAFRDLTRPEDGAWMAGKILELVLTGAMLALVPRFLKGERKRNFR